MCGILKELSNICRLCLTLLQEDEISAHEIFTSDGTQSKACKSTACNVNFEKPENLCSNKMCKSCDKMQMKQNKTDLNQNAKVPDVPLSLTSTKVDINDHITDTPFSILKQHRTHISSLSKHNDKVLQSIFANLGGGDCDDSPPITTQILKCLSLEVLPNDGLPAVVCCNCRSQLKVFWRFKCLAQRADIALRKYLDVYKATEEGLMESSETCLNQTISTKTCVKSSSERMAAKALTELSNSAKAKLFSLKVNKNIQSSFVEDINCTNSIKSENFTKDLSLERNIDTADNSVYEMPNPTSKRFEKLQHDLITSEDKDKNLSLQQQLETAAVLMDISKKVIISPPCSNPESPCLASDSSIKNSVIKSKRPLDSKLTTEMDLSVKKPKLELVNFSDLLISESHNDLSNIKSFGTNEPLNIFDTKEEKLSSDSEHSLDSNRLEMDITTLTERRTPESVASEDHGTDAATTQLWQALAHSAANNVESHETNRLLQLLNKSFTFPVAAPKALLQRDSREEPIALLKSNDEQLIGKVKLSDCIVSTDGNECITNHYISMEDAVYDKKNPKNSTSANSAQKGMSCSNCGTLTTTIWRRNIRGEIVCNACGLYFKLHGINRPHSMRRDTIHTRRRRPKDSEKSDKKKNKSDNYTAETMEKKYIEGISTSLNEKSEDVKLRFGSYANKDIITFIKNNGPISGTEETDGKKQTNVERTSKNKLNDGNDDFVAPLNLVASANNKLT
uniref:GATA-type domain-containing protein n=1 Tax=Glossina brevipalpis TaxID=37001 RepID=A0A1A9WEX2_9MUSC